MATIPKHPILDRSNADILNAIRNQATPAYQKRVPVATAANLERTFQAITSSNSTRNEFEAAFVNKIAMQRVLDQEEWENPLAKFKLPKLEYGHTIEDIKVGLIQANALDNGADYLGDAVFKRYGARVEAQYHSVNREDVYPITIPQQALRSAFLNEGGLAAYTSALLAAPRTSDNWDEFLLMSSLFSRYERADGFFKVSVADLGHFDSDGADSRSALRRFREMSGNLGFISERYNASRMPAAIKPDDLELFITPEANAAIDVEALAGAFNIDRAEVGYRTTLVPQEHFNIPGAQAILTSRDFFVVADQVYETASIQNPANLTTQHFLHHYQVMSASRFVPAVLFGTDAGTIVELSPRATDNVQPITVTDIEGVTVTTVERGSAYRVEGAGVTADGETTATILSVENAEHAGTFVTQAGTLRIDRSETSDSITLVSTAVDNANEARITLTVTGDIVYTWPNPQVVSDADSDGLEEVTPVEPSQDADGVVTIPTVRGVQYRTGPDGFESPAVNGARIEAPVRVVATARPGWELSGDAGPWDYAATP